MKNVLVLKKELFIYTLIGGIATIIDWSIFATAVTLLNIHYLPALILAYCTAGSFHYIANKVITFRCESKKIASQVTIYFAMMLISLAFNMLIMLALVKIFIFHKIALRMITTLLMLVPNYLLHKHITFNKYLFAPQTVG